MTTLNVWYTNHHVNVTGIPIAGYDTPTFTHDGTVYVHHNNHIRTITDVHDHHTQTGWIFVTVDHDKPTRSTCVNAITRHLWHHHEPVLLDAIMTGALHPSTITNVTADIHTLKRLGSDHTDTFTALLARAQHAATNTTKGTP